MNVKGVIVGNDDAWIYDFFDMEHTSPNLIRDAIDQANGESLEVEINSGGGDVFAGSEIYTALKEYDGKVTTKVVGLAASMGSVIAMAGDNIQMSPTSQIMIHNVWSMAMGDYRDMQHQSDILQNLNKTIASAYGLKSGLDESELLAMMDEETWLSAEQAKEKGFIDEILFKDDIQFAASLQQGLLPREVINKVRNQLIEEKSNQVDHPTPDKSDFLMQKFNLLKLRKDVE